jgi:hypothetical protein
MGRRRVRYNWWRRGEKLRERRGRNGKRRERFN